MTAWRLWWVACVVVLAGAMAGCAPGGVQSIGFGMGGSGCTLANGAASFPAGSSVQMVAEFSPPLAAGETVTITVSKDGTNVADGSGTLQLDQPQSCIGGTLPTLAAGHYKVVIASTPKGTGMPALAGEFDVTP